MTNDEQIAALRTALTKCRDQFRKYAQIHRDKKPPSMAKAIGNDAMADMCDKALAATAQPVPERGGVDWTWCPKCDGTGSRIEGDYVKKCRNCKGTGKMAATDAPPGPAKAEAVDHAAVVDRIEALLMSRTTTNDADIAAEVMYQTPDLLRSHAALVAEVERLTAKQERAKQKIAEALANMAIAQGNTDAAINDYNEMKQRAERAEAALAEAQGVIGSIVEWGYWHDGGCPEDDTCSCTLAKKINEIMARPA